MDRTEDAAVFEEWRSLLFAIAYRMLGSAADAEDMVQEAGVRWLQRSEGTIASVRAYLVTIVTRLCIDHLRSARVQRVSYTGPWLPEPIVMDDDDVADRADSLSLAFLVLLEELTGPSGRPTSSTTSSATASTRWPSPWVGHRPGAASSPLVLVATSATAGDASMPIFDRGKS